jgi:hypothetical protein
VLASASGLSAHPIPHGAGMEGGASRSFLKEDFVKEAHPPSNGFPTAKFSASGRDLLPCLAPALLAMIGKGPSPIKKSYAKVVKHMLPGTSAAGRPPRLRHSAFLLHR